MDGTKDTRHGIEDTDPHMGMLKREKDAEHRTQRMQDTGDTQGMYVRTRIPLYVNFLTAG